MEQLESRAVRYERGDGLNDCWKNWKHWNSPEEHRDGLTEFKHRDGLSNVERGFVKKYIEKQRRHLTTIERVGEIEATIDSGAACGEFVRDLCNDVPIRQCAEIWRGMLFRTHQDNRVQR